MGLRQVVTCDVCGVEKTLVNHWYVAWLAPDGAFTAAPFGNWSVESSELQVQFHCGQACHQKAHQRWMDTGSLDKPKDE